MNSLCLKVFAGSLLVVLALGPTDAHAGLFETLRSVSDTISKITGVHIDEFKKLAESEKIEEAVALYAKEKDYFASLKDDNRRYVDGVLAQRDQSYRAELGEVRASLVLAAREEGQMLRWQQLKVAIQQAQALQSRVEKLAAPGLLMTEGLKSLRATLDSTTQTLQQDAPRALLSYGLYTEPAFATKYPIAVNWTGHSNFDGVIGVNLEKANPLQLEIFKKAFADTLIPAMGVGPKLNELYITARLRESQANSFLAKRLLRDRLAKEGWPTADKSGGTVLLAAWPMPQSDVSTYKVRFPSSVRYLKLSSDQTPAAFIASGGVGAHELVVFLRHEPIRMQRNVSNEQQINSQYKNGTQRIQNPEYARAQQALRVAQQKFQTVKQSIANSSASNANNTLGALAALVSVATEAAAENDVDTAQRKLEETPQVIEEPVLVPYTFTTKTLMVKQSVVTHYAIYDAGINKVFTGSIERTWSKSFAVADRVRADDPSYAASTYTQSTKAAQDWTKSPIEDGYEEIWNAVFSDHQKNSLGI